MGLQGLCRREKNAVGKKKGGGKTSKTDKNHPKRYERFSGKWYRNSPEKLQAIKEKYRNGVSKTQIEDWINSL